ncbi:hypothetical protein V8E55_010033 [Tylopilus felleus]
MLTIPTILLIIPATLLIGGAFLAGHHKQPHFTYAYEHAGLIGHILLVSLPVCTSNNLPQPTPCPTIGDLLSALSKHAELANMSYSALDMFTCCANQLKNDILLPQPQSISHLEPPLVLPPSIAGFLANVSGILPALVDCLWVIV